MSCVQPRQVYWRSLCNNPKAKSGLAVTFFANVWSCYIIVFFCERRRLCGSGDAPVAPIAPDPLDFGPSECSACLRSEVRAPAGAR